MKRYKIERSEEENKKLFESGCPYYSEARTPIIAFGIVVIFSIIIALIFLI